MDNTLRQFDLLLDNVSEQFVNRNVGITPFRGNSYKKVDSLFVQRLTSSRVLVLLARLSLVIYVLNEILNLY